MWFSLYMLLIQFVDMHLFSLFWLLLSFFFFSIRHLEHNVMDVLFGPGEEKKTCDIFVIPSIETISGHHLNEICTNTRNKRKKTTNRNNNQNQTAAHNRVATAGIFQTLVGGGAVCMYDTCMRLMGATRTIRSISSSLLSPPSSLLPPSYSSSPRGVMGGWAPPRWYTQPPVVSPQVTGVNWQRLPCEEKKPPQDWFFFSSLLPPKTQKRRLKLTFYIACQILLKLHVMMLFSFFGI